MRTLAVILTLGAAARLGHADPEDPPVAPVEQVDPAAALFDEGRALLDAHQPGPACEKFEASLRLEPDSLGTILNLGLCNEELDKLATALRWFHRVQVRASELQKPDAEAAAKEKSALLAAKVPTLAIAFSHSPPRDTAVAVDGVKIDEIDYARIEVDAGTHDVAMTSPGLAEKHTTATLVDRDNLTLTLAIPAPPPPPREEIIDRGAHRRAQAYVLAGVGASLLIGDTVLALIAKSRFDDTDVLSTRNDWKNVARYGATSMFVAGTAAVATAIYLYVKAPGRERVLVPSVSAEHLGLSLVGSF